MWIIILIFCHDFILLNWLFILFSEYILCAREKQKPFMHCASDTNQCLTAGEKTFSICIDIKS